MRYRRMALALLLVAGELRAADPAVADRDHGFYFNRPGATVAQVDADTDRCEKLDAKTVPSARYAGGGLMGALVSGIASGIRKGSERRRNFETCMVVAGWREVFLTSADVEALKAAVARDRVAALTPITGAAEVKFGTIGRVWANNFAEPGTEAMR